MTNSSTNDLKKENNEATQYNLSRSLVPKNQYKNKQIQKKRKIIMRIKRNEFGQRNRAAFFWLGGKVFFILKFI